MKDTLTRFIFENLPIRGLVVQLNDAWSTLKTRKDYPEVVQHKLGEIAAANVLLASSLKLQGSMTMQIQGDGQINLLVMDCNSQHQIRGMAHYSEHVIEGNLQSLFGTGSLVITIDNKKTSERYQGIVELVGEKTQDALENYLERSEQLATKLILFTSEQCAAGLLLQKLPHETLKDEDDWNRVVHLADTITQEELTQLDAQTIIHRLFNEDDVRLLESEACEFKCTCSPEKVSNMLVSLGKEELDAIVEEQGSIDIDCEFCNQHYSFDKIDVETLFITDVTPPSDTQH